MKLLRKDGKVHLYRLLDGEYMIRVNKARFFYRNQMQALESYEIMRFTKND